MSRLERKITPVHYTVLIKVFELEGFKVSREKGDHIIMTRTGIKRPLVIKKSPKMLPVTHIRTNMTTAEISRERYFELLDEVK